GSIAGRIPTPATAFTRSNSLSGGRAKQRGVELRLRHLDGAVRNLAAEIHVEDIVPLRVDLREDARVLRHVAPPDHALAVGLSPEAAFELRLARAEILPRPRRGLLRDVDDIVDTSRDARRSAAVIVEERDVPVRHEPRVV